jgi:hypothetical protein
MSSAGWLLLSNLAVPKTLCPYPQSISEEKYWSRICPYK